MSLTPITDSKAVLFEMGFPVLNCQEVVDAAEMRKLEIELHMLRGEVADLRHFVLHMSTERL